MVIIRFDIITFVAAVSSPIKDPSKLRNVNLPAVDNIVVGVRKRCPTARVVLFIHESS